MLQALVADHDVSAISWDALDLDATNRFFGTSLRSNQFVASRPSRMIRWVISRLPFGLEQMRIALLVREAHKRGNAEPHDLFLTASKEIDFGPRGIQYVHYPWGAWHLPPGGFAFSCLSRLYRRLCQWIGGRSMARLRRNLTLANSSFIATKIREEHGIDPIVLPPPVAGAFPDVPWNERRNDFACIGRLAPDKDPLKVIEIVSGVRDAGYGVSLDLVGMPDDPAYGCLVRQSANERPWVRVHQDLSRAALVELVTSCRYGIHGMIDEHFGMSVAEMVAAGCIVFVPDRGGPVEIVGADPRLVYGSVGEAVGKIVAVLRTPETLRDVRQKLLRRRAPYGAGRFVISIRSIVADFLAASGS